MKVSRRQAKFGNEESLYGAVRTLFIQLYNKGGYNTAITNKVQPLMTPTGLPLPPNLKIDTCENIFR